MSGITHNDPVKVGGENDAPLAGMDGPRLGIYSSKPMPFAFRFI